MNITINIDYTLYKLIDTVINIDQEHQKNRHQTFQNCKLMVVFIQQHQHVSGSKIANVQQHQVLDTNLQKIGYKHSKIIWIDRYMDNSKHKHSKVN